VNKQQQKEFKEKYVKTLKKRLFLPCTYELKKDLSFKMPFSLPTLEINKHIKVSGNSCFLKKGWIWDGASGISIDTLNMFFPAIVHDVYCIILENHTFFTRKEADIQYLRLLLENDMNTFRAMMQYRAIRAYMRIRY